MELVFLMGLILRLLPGQIPVPLADLFPVEKGAVETAEVLEQDHRRVDIQEAVIPGDGFFRHDDAAVALPSDKDPAGLFVFKPLPRQRSLGDFQNDFSGHDSSPFSDDIRSQFQRLVPS